MSWNKSKDRIYTDFFHSSFRFALVQSASVIIVTIDLSLKSTKNPISVPQRIYCHMQMTAIHRTKAIPLRATINGKFSFSAFFFLCVCLQWKRYTHSSRAINFSAIFRIYLLFHHVSIRKIYALLHLIYPKELRFRSISFSRCRCRCHRRHVRRQFAVEWNVLGTTIAQRTEKKTIEQNIIRSCLSFEWLPDRLDSIFSNQLFGCYGGKLLAPLNRFSLSSHRKTLAKINLVCLSLNRVLAVEWVARFHARMSHNFRQT